MKAAAFFLFFFYREVDIYGEQPSSAGAIRCPGLTGVLHTGNAHGATAELPDGSSTAVTLRPPQRCLHLYSDGERPTL